MKPKGKPSEMNREEIINLCRYYKGEETKGTSTELCQPCCR